VIITDHIGAILVVTGVVTASPILQYLLPGLGLKVLFQLTPPAEAGGFFTRHWGLIVGGFGALLVYSASHPELRAPLMLVAVIEKAGLVGMIAADWKKPHTKGMRLTAAFDSTCVVLYGLYLLHLA
jgi:Na+-transporting NADH:ubiquinone oxidoreductase subunit NqrB